MNKTLSNIADRLKKDKKLLFIIAMGLVGSLLLLISEIAPDTADKRLKNTSETDIYALQYKTEKEIENLLKTVDGVGRVKALVSIDSLEERIIARDTESASGEDSLKVKEEYVLIKDGNNTKGLTLKVITPVIRGVAVSCEGGDSNIVRAEITKLVSAGLGISSNKVWVSKMKE